MFAHLLDRHLERALRPGRPLPRWLRGLLDETFLWVAAGQLLLALGVRPGSVRRLSEVHDALEEARAVLGAAGHPMPRLEDVRTYEELEELGERFDAFLRGLEEIDLEELARIAPAPQAMSRAVGAAAVLLDLSLEVLDRLRARRIRTELVGLDHRALREGVLRLRRMLDRAGLPEVAEHGYAAIGRRLEQLEAAGELDGLALETRPVAPGPGEAGRLVDIVRSLPRPTLDRLIPLRLLSSRPVMITALTRALAELRTGWVPPAERPDPAASDPAQRRAAAWEAERVGHRRAVDERDARPEVRRAHTVQAGLLWAATAVVTAWMLWLVLGIVDPEWSSALAEGTSLPRAALWLLPAGAVSLVAALAVPAAEIIQHLDRAELTGHLPAGAARQRTRARRARARAAAAASRAGGALVLLAPVLAVVIGISRSFGEGLAAVDELGGAFAAALLVPLPVVLAASLWGIRRGEALEAARRPQLPPEQPAAVGPPPAV